MTIEHFAHLKRNLTPSNETGFVFCIIAAVFLSLSGCASIVMNIYFRNSFYNSWLSFTILQFSAGFLWISNILGQNYRHHTSYQTDYNFLNIGRSSYSTSMLDNFLVTVLPLIISIDVIGRTTKSKVYSVLSYCISIIFSIIGLSVCETVDIENIVLVIANYIIFVLITTSFRQLHAHHSFLLEQKQESIETTAFQLRKKLNDDHDSQLRHMISNLAHDLKTPLTALISTLDLLRESFVDLKSILKDPNNQWMASIEESMDSLDSINTMMLMVINRCIDYVKASKGMDLLPQNQAISMHEIIGSVVQCARQFHQENNISIPTLNEFDSEISTDHQWLSENLLCMITNSSKFNCRCNISINVRIASGSRLVVERKIHKNGVFFDFSAAEQSSVIDRRPSIVDNSLKKELPRPSMRSRTDPSLRRAMALARFDNSRKKSDDATISHDSGDSSRKSRFIVFEVTDNGNGLSNEVLSSLFKPGNSTEKALTSGGTGLGLYTLACRIKALQGFYGAYNVVDTHGSTFWFAVPYNRVEMNSYSIKNSLFKPTLLPCSPQSTSHDNSKSCSISHRDKMAIIKEVGGSDTSSSKYIISNTNNNLQQYITNNNESDKLKYNREVTLSPCNYNNKIINKSFNILVVDDSRPILKTISRSLELKGHHVITAFDGQDGVDMYLKISSDKNFNLHIILMDINMPIMDGFDAIKKIREIENDVLQNKQQVDIEEGKEKNANGVPLVIIACSANSDAKTGMKAKQCGADAFVGKPFKIEEIFIKYGQIITNHIDRKL
eukprot:gene14447-19386_t